MSEVLSLSLSSNALEHLAESHNACNRLEVSLGDAFCLHLLFMCIEEEEFNDVPVLYVCEYL